jgi:hypothetical protein
MEATATKEANMNINERISAACEAMDFGSDYAKFLIPNIQTEQQAETFTSATMRIVKQMEMHNGVAWIGVLNVAGIAVNVSYDGNGGTYYYDAADCDGLRRVEAFAEALYDDDYGTPMDQMVDAIEIMQAVAA